MPGGWTEEFVAVAGANIQYYKGGSGPPLVALHGLAGNPGWLIHHEKLAERYTVYAPSHPGYEKSQRPEWVESIQDLALFYTWFMEELGLDGANAVGLSIGGWVVAEMAVICPHAFGKLVLADAPGIRPESGEITDVFLMSEKQVNEMMFHDTAQAPEFQELFGVEPSFEDQDRLLQNRETLARLTWKPYMHDPRFPALLERVKAPCLIVWGKQDPILPLECAELYQKAIRGSSLKVLENCGHYPHVEKPEEFSDAVIEFLG